MQLNSRLRAGLLAMNLWLKLPSQLGPQWGEFSQVMR